jgi:5-carboxymethyl-2-hydroxymuconate isomerase
MKMEVDTLVVFALNTREFGVGEVGRKTLWNNRYARFSWVDVPLGHAKPDKAYINMIVAVMPGAKREQAKALCADLNSLAPQQARDLQQVTARYDALRNDIIGGYSVANYKEG